MSVSNYQPCLKQMLVYEGGYSNHPSDPGGVTLEGVIQTRYNEYRKAKGLPQKALTPGMRGTPSWIAERNEIYRRYYWNPVNGDGLHAGVDLAVFDYAVNSGPGRALPHFAPYRALAPVAAVKGLCARRLSFVRGLGTFKVFGPGWSRRIANVEAIGVKMALTFINAPVPRSSPVAKKEAEEKVATELTKESNTAGKTATTQAGGAATTGGAAGGAVVNDPSVLTFDWLSIGVGALFIGVVVFLGYRIFINLQRKKAYADAAASVG